MKNLTSGLLALLYLFSISQPARASSSTVLDVTGLIAPSACEVTLSDNGIVDHGRVPARSLNQYEFSALPMQTLDLGVSCNEPVLFVLVGLDNRADSSLGPGFYYGLGHNIHAPGERLGTVSIAFRDVMADGSRVLVLASSNQGLTWFPESNAYPDNYMGFARLGTLVPEPHRLLNATLNINTSINAAAFLTLNQEVPLDGSIVLDLRYM
ncbi:DUF1120 domain-containing protein [Pseudomonas palleroniana]|uniref:DUF1120 domain-containing protein n=1 Tax=Pseudomonas palleroniana TaxID=191390 RepID=UPI0018E68FE1|nr:DUF1120 domain-containing protein [Pseudomonas palleroniana]MBI6906838.1 DUF1120 domain-containing protein [Pseudomonas palleroniana]